VIFERTSRFKRAAKKLTTEDRDRLDKALLRYEQDPSHPSLGVKRVQGTKGIWEARASDALRFTFEKIEGGVLLRNVGAHDPTLKSP
jgi:mRNA-degrading endonuclease RelE of RelBE toxin-antitoxin system